MKTPHLFRRRPLRPQLLAAAIIATLTPALLQPLQAHQDEKSGVSMGGSAHGEHSHGGTFTSTGQGWAVIQGGVSRIERALAAHDLPPVHEAEEAISTALRWLQENSPEVTGDKRKRLEAALKQAITSAGNLHAASDAGDQIKSEAEFKKLRGALKLIEAQYPAEALKPPADRADAHTHNPAAEPTTIVTVTPTAPLKVGEKADAIVKLSKRDGTPVLPSDLDEAHTEKIHLLIIDASLTDYHHEHPEATSTPGEYAFSFTPRKLGPYRVWADLIPTATGTQEYAIADIASQHKGEPITDRAVKTAREAGGLKFEITFDKPEIKAGDAVLGKLTITKGDGTLFDQLEPLMGAYAHIVGFGEDYQSIAHIHPMGKEPTQPTDRGIGKLEFHLLPAQPGLMRLFAQVQIDGKDVFVPYTLNVKPQAAKVVAKPEVGPSSQTSAVSKEALDLYIRIQTALAADSLAGVPEAAGALLQALGKDSSSTPPATIVEQAKALAHVTDIAKARIAFKALSASMIATVGTRNLETNYFVANCPMARASWIQVGRSIKNPYYGKSMLECGTLQLRINAGKNFAPAH